jgi:HEAT repeat protein
MNCEVFTASTVLVQTGEVARGPSAYFQFWEHFDDRSSSGGDGGPLLALFDEMTPRQRHRVEHELLHRLMRDPTTDGWVLAGLGALGSVEAVPMLRDLVRSPVAEDAAIALWRISRWRGAVRVLDRVVRGERDRGARPPTLSRRIEAATYLAEIGSPQAHQILATMVHRGDAPLRLQRAIEQLLRRPSPAH